MPLERDMIHLEADVHLCSLGTIWTKKDGWFQDHVLLGSVTASPGMRDDLKKISSVAEGKESAALQDLHP